MDKAKLKTLIAKLPAERLRDKKGQFVDAWLTPPARVAFAYLSEPKPGKKPGDTAFYKCALLFPVGVDLSLLNDAIRERAQAAFPGVKPGKLSLPMKSQDDNVDEYDGFEVGGFYFDCKSKFKPDVFGPKGPSQVITDPNALYSGMWVRAKITCYTFDGDENRGVGFGLTSLQKLADDERWGGESTAGDGFGAVEIDDAPATTGAVSKSSAADDDWTK